MLKRSRLSFLIFMLILGLIAPTGWSRPPLERVTIENSSQVSREVDELLLRLSAVYPEGSAPPSVLFVHPEAGNWGQFQKDLSVVLDRHGLKVAGVVIETTDATEAQRAAMAKAGAESGIAIEFELSSDGEISDATDRRLSAFFGVQLNGKHFKDLYNYYRGRDRYRFRWVTTVPKGFGGGARKQLKYIFIASMNSLALATSNPVAYDPSTYGLPTAICFALTYAFNAGADYLNYLRLTSRNPYWQTDPNTGERRLVSGATTYSRGYFFLVTWGVIAASNAAIISPLYEMFGSVWGILRKAASHALLNVYSFVWAEQLFAHYRKKELDEKRKLLTLEESDESSRERIEASAQQARWIYENGRPIYYGGIHPWIKNPNLVGAGITSYILLVVGTAGMVFDQWKNGYPRRFLNYVRRNLWPGPTEAKETVPCSTYLIAGSEESIENLILNLRAEPTLPR